VKVPVMLAILFVSGCASVQAPSDSQIPTSAEERVVEKNYTVGLEKTTFVGDAMVRVKDYRVQKRTQSAMLPSSDFSIFFPLIGPTVAVRADEPLPIVGTTQRDGSEFTLVRFPRSPPISFLITKDGRFEGSGLSPLGNARMGYTYTLNPSTVTFRHASTTATAIEAGFVNFEIVYSGSTKDSIRLLYREYTPKDLARPAYSQELVYERGAPTIRFRSIVMRVSQASAEDIRFAVLEDGYNTPRNN
jgi:hypothetical protein